ncbi:MAG: tape measure protein [Syntrophorhabdaceae bacterium]
MPSLKIDIIVDDKGRPVINQATASMKELGNATDQTNSKFKDHSSSVSGVQSSYSSLLGAVAALSGAYLTLKSSIDAALKMEQITYSMKAVSGSAEIAAKEFAYVKAESERLGLVMSDTALSFAKFSAATRNTSIEGQETKKVFSAVAEAATALKLPGEQVNGIFMALQQMMSKGKVQAEELRGQLGERLPGAFNMAAEAMGVSTAKLNEMLEKGEVLGSELLPKLAEKLHETYGVAAKESAEGGQAAINRFTNAVFESKAVLGDSLMPILVAVADVFKSIVVPAVQAAVFGVQTLTLNVMGLIDKWGILTRSFSNPIDFVVQKEFNTKRYQQYAADIAQINGNVDASRLDMYNKMNPGGGMGKATGILGYEGGTYTYEAPAGKKGGSGSGKGGVDKALKEANKEYEQFIKNIDKGEQAMYSSWMGQGGGAGEDGIWRSKEEWKEEAKALVEYEKLMQDFEEKYALNTANAQSELEALKNDNSATVKDMADIWENGMSSMADALTEFCKSGKLDFSNMVDSMIADLMKLFYKQAMFGKGDQGGGLFEKGLGMIGGMFGGYDASLTGQSMGAGDWTAGLGFHSGGRVGLDAPSFVQALPSSVFASAKRYHSGLASDEFPAILQKGETVIPKGGGATPNVNVIINNTNGSEVTQKATPNGNGGVDLEVMIGNAVASQMNKRGSAPNRAMRQGFGSRPTLTSR